MTRRIRSTVKVTSTRIDEKTTPRQARDRWEGEWMLARDLVLGGELVDPPWLFIHPPRTGGTSVRSQIGNDALRRDHLQMAAYRTVPWLDLDKKVKFTIARNPYDRAVSICCYAHRELDRVLDIETFEMWVEAGMTTPYTVNSNTPWKADVAAPQTDYYKPEEMHVIARFENFAHARRRISQIVGMTLDDRCERPSKRLPGGWKPYYRRADIMAAVAEKYAQDFLMLEYYDLQ